MSFFETTTTAITDPERPITMQMGPDGKKVKSDRELLPLRRYAETVTAKQSGAALDRIAP